MWSGDLLLSWVRKAVLAAHCSLAMDTVRISDKIPSWFPFIHSPVASKVLSFFQSLPVLFAGLAVWLFFGQLYFLLLPEWLLFVVPGVVVFTRQSEASESRSHIYDTSRVIYIGPVITTCTLPTMHIWYIDKPAHTI